ncbi:MAG: tyrosine-type recombinase/integrase [Acidobacteriia bacterium]|nr:tyrosine-type recombinase/integrase [Terriglobia bacterium]
MRWHDLRHTFASRMAMAGRSLLEIKEAMRHKTIQMTLRYAHLMPSRIQDAVEAIVRKPTDTTTDTGLFEPGKRATALIQ